ncbi:hypothetical protein Ancab_038881 [Ancistrocladus abbreviatus]
MSKAAHFVWRNPDHLRRIFSQFSEPSVSHYGAMIRACSDSDCPREGIEFFGKMQRDGLLPDAVASSFCLKCCAVIRSLVGGVQVHSRILVGGHQFDSRLMATLMDVYSVCEKCDDACKVFVDITHKDTVVWNVLISCLLNNCRTRDALEVFDIMQRRQHRCKPDVVTCLWLLQGCGTLGDLDFGKRIHSFIDERGYGNAINLGNALISMYSKCGRMDEAYKVFDKMPRKTVVSWTALIFGLAINGYGRDAIDVFWEMLSVGILPDAHTFTGVLSACSRSGLVDEGIQFFEQMTRDFGIVPNIHHYGCMVDLLGRAGLLNQAYELIVSMRIKPDPTIWRILLGACRIYKQAPLGEHVIPQLVELKAQESGDYILLLSVYSSRGDTEKVTLLRKYMMENGIQAMPGCSTIELKGVVHEFVADDSSHPQKDEIYNELIDIGQQLKIAGYVPETLQELDNQNEAEKGAMLSYHSEKLAIAFAVLATPPSTTIRVAKNPKICVDCHNFAKLFSSVYDRKVIIWDHRYFSEPKGEFQLFFLKCPLADINEVHFVPTDALFSGYEILRSHQMKMEQDNGNDAEVVHSGMEWDWFMDPCCSALLNMKLPIQMR